MRNSICHWPSGSSMPMAPVSQMRGSFSVLSPDVANFRSAGMDVQSASRRIQAATHAPISRPQMVAAVQFRQELLVLRLPSRSPSRRVQHLAQGIPAQAVPPGAISFGCAGCACRCGEPSADVMGRRGVRSTHLWARVPKDSHRVLITH